MRDTEKARLPDPRQQPTMTVTEAGEILGLAKGGTYDAIHRGDLPVLRIGRRLLIPTAGLYRLLQIDAPAVDRMAGSPDG